MTRPLALALAVGLAGCAGSRAPAPPPAGAPPPVVGGGPAPAPTLAERLDAVEPVVLAAPPWAYTLADAGGRRALAVPRLVPLLERPNTITDGAAWLARYGLDAPGAPSSPRHAPPALYRGAVRQRVIDGGDVTLVVYGDDAATGRYLFGLADDGVRFAYDFARYLRAPGPAGPPGLTEQGVTWAALADDRLYVQTNHLTYAETSGGRNGYVTALDAATGALRWRSRPLVANARTFEVVGDALVTGYGFTREPDHLFVLDRFTGEVRGETPVRTAPEWIVRQGDRLLVRAYDADYEFALR